MSRLLVFLPILITALVLAGCTAQGPASPGRDGQIQLRDITLSRVEYESAVRDLMNSDRVIPGEISLKPVEGADIDDIADEWNLNLIDYKEFINFYHFALPEGADTATVVAELRDDPRVEVAEPIYTTTMSQLRVDPNDTRFVSGEQWYLENMDVPEAWVIEPGEPAIEPVPLTSDVAVAVLDTGFDYFHSDLNLDGQGNVNAKIFAGFDFINGDSNPQDDNGHGTMVTGIIGARTGNNNGIASVGWNPRIIPVKVLDQAGKGDSATTTDGIWFAIQEFNENKNALDPFDAASTLFANPFNARLVINMSYTYETPNSLGPSQMELSAVQYAINHGALLVAAVGDGARPLNNGATTIYPASHTGVIKVGATDQANALSPDTNSLPAFANPATEPFFVAPGVDILSTFPVAFSDGYAVGSGTSFSAAMVSGVIALIWSQFPFLSPSEVIDTLAIGADADLLGGLGPDFISGRGLVNALDSLQRDFTPNPTNEPMIVRAFTSPILHGDIMFVVKTKYRLLPATDTPPPQDPENPDSPLINNGMPFSYTIGWDYDLDGAVDDPFPMVLFLNTYYWRHEIQVSQLDSATYVGRIHMPLGLPPAAVDPFPMGQLVIEFVGVPYHRAINADLPQTVSASTTIQINEFNYDLPG